MTTRSPCINTPFPRKTDCEERNAIDCLTSGKLYITNWRGASNRSALLNLGVTHIAAIGDEFLSDTMDGMVFHHQDISDDPEQAPRLHQLLRETSGFIDNAIRRGGCVLVHCAAGASRSATVALAYLVLHERLTLRAAFEKIWAARRATWPNEQFMEALIAFEREHTGAATLSLEEYEAWGEVDEGECGRSPSAPGRPPTVPTLQRQRTNLETEKQLEEAARRSSLSDISNESNSPPYARAGSSGEAASRAAPQCKPRVVHSARPASTRGRFGYPLMGS